MGTHSFSFSLIVKENEGYNLSANEEEERYYIQLKPLKSSCESLVPFDVARMMGILKVWINIGWEDEKDVGIEGWKIGWEEEGWIVGGWEDKWEVWKVVNDEI